MTQQLTAVIVTFNRLDKLRFTLQRSLALNFYRVIVVDNCSTDGTGDWLESIDNDRLIVIRSEKNVGGAGGFNLGFNYAATELPESDWLVCYDDDAYPSESAVDTFNSLDIPADAGSLAAAVYLPNGDISEMNRPSRNPFWHLRELLMTSFRGRQGFHIKHSDYQSKSAIEIDSSSFVGCFVRLSLIRQGAIGLPRKELFIYADDIIYLLELRRAGFRHLFYPQIVFNHDCETLIEQRDVYHPLWKAYYVLRNRLEMYRVASGLFHPLVFLIKIPAFFLNYRFYEQKSRRAYLHVAKTAILDGLRKDYRKSHQQVVQLSSIAGDK